MPITRMSKSPQNFIILVELSDDAWRISAKCANMYFNRFCIHEDASHELSGVYYLTKSSEDMILNEELDEERETKGRGRVCPVDGAFKN